ncbi:hypothetical protein BKA67DRAFT_184554 [Truncatella angustata]|uniref:Nascent polypeptide-associated complex subunit alpha-like UBA domain-containing protein n=1 Tax=Truncatella angustata TaxID=152316 RepID=A0A9P8US00_9PEZI|nr:uncharacterized protein BKA67DRAFT_184554 [Truncatella angustata]KAH6657284.1 hypothetical protein BKA67DRAFT_184554 [Truncatella angustata]KAH8197290.1 hypothetical protein TruAng_008534 [Truncatella angustata]
MAEPQPPNVHEGATTGDVEDEVTQAKSAEDRKAAAAMSRLDDNDDDAGSAQVDKDALKGLSLGGSGAGAAKTEVKKVKIDAADVTLLVDQLDLPKSKATELLKAHDGDAVKAMRALFTAP